MLSIYALFSLQYIYAVYRVVAKAAQMGEMPQLIFINVKFTMKNSKIIVLKLRKQSSKFRTEKLLKKCRNCMVIILEIYELLRSI